MNRIQHTDAITGKGNIKFGYDFAIKIVIITKVTGRFFGISPVLFITAVKNMAKLFINVASKDHIQSQCRELCS